MTITLSQTHPLPVSIANMDAIIKSNNARPSTQQQRQKELSFRTLGETAMLSESSCSMSSCEVEEDTDAVMDKQRQQQETQVTTLPPLLVQENRTRVSILKPSTDEIPISLKGRPFKHLPPPDLEEIKRNSPSVTTTLTSSRPCRQRQDSVGFSSVIIREYDQTIGDNPSVSYGPPISLDWEYTQLECVTLEHYEAHRPPRRTMRQMCMNYYTYVLF